MSRKILAAGIVALTANAYALDGTVIDGSGNAVPDALVEIVGSKDNYKTDENGSFTIDDAVTEIHITAKGYSHQIVTLNDLNEPLVVTLNRSVIEQVDVKGLPFHASAIESAQPISVLSGETLRNQQASTLGDSLDGLVGVHTSFYGNVASSPIIRGLDGPRVLITQNSLDVSDASRVGPDHIVASEVSTAEQIEVLRGPATLFFGSGAIGGVVNVVDNRIPSSAETYGEWSVSHDTVNSQELGSFSVNTGVNDFAFHVDGFWREADEYEVPVAADIDDEESTGDYVVENTAEESQGYTLGTSYLLDNGFVGVSYERFERVYGIPGHSHGEEEHEEDEHDHEEEESHDDGVYADLEQDRYQLISELDIDNGWLSAINSRLAYTEYTHAEIEDGAVGTRFSNEATEMKVDLLHQPLDGWNGGLVVHYKASDFSAVGEEAFTPPSETENFALALIEERHFGDVLVQLGARVETVTINADEVLLPELEVHGHDEEEAEDEHDHDEATSVTRVFAVEHEFTPFSFSAGAVWDFKPGYNVAASLSRSERAPSAAELLSFGPHIGTGSYEIGALFDLHEEDGESHFELNEASIDMETSNNIDLTFRKYEGDVGIILNVFYNQINNYYYQSATGYFAETGHEHEEESSEEDSHEDELPVYLYTSADVNLYGFEAQSIWQITPSLKTTVFADYVRAELDGDGYLPRISPMRVGARFDYQWGDVASYISWTNYADQNDVADLETATDGYNWVDAAVSWTFPVASSELVLFAKVENLTDTEARVHTSFIKDVAPKPGRNFSIGLRGSF